MTTQISAKDLLTTAAHVEGEAPPFSELVKAYRAAALEEAIGREVLSETHLAFCSAEEKVRHLSRKTAHARIALEEAALHPDFKSTLDALRKTW